MAMTSADGQEFRVILCTLTATLAVVCARRDTDLRLDYGLQPRHKDSVVPARFFMSSSENRAKDLIFTINYGITFCKEADSPYLLFIIRSATKHFERRDAIRMTWGIQDSINGQKIKFVFLLGVPFRDSILQNRLLEESEKHLDMVQADFHDTYANLTLKDRAAFQWATLYCPKATFVAVTSDEVYVNIPMLVLHHLPPTKAVGHEISFCYLFPCCTRVYTESESKYRVQNGLYEGLAYPSYCSGTLYIAPSAVVYELRAVALDTPAFMPDDAWIGVLLEKLGIKLRDAYSAFVGITRGEPHVAERFIASANGGPDAESNIVVAVLDYAYPGEEHNKMVEIWHSIKASSRMQHELRIPQENLNSKQYVTALLAVQCLALAAVFCLVYARRRQLCRYSNRLGCI